MDKLDATDTKNVILAPGMIERAIKNGRYKPAEPGVYKDFNFRAPWLRPNAVPPTTTSRATTSRGRRFSDKTSPIPRSSRTPPLTPRRWA